MVWYGMLWYGMYVGRYVCLYVCMCLCMYMHMSNYNIMYIYIYLGSKQSPNSHDEALVQAGLLHPGRAVAGWFPATARPSRLKSFTMLIAYG